MVAIPGGTSDVRQRLPTEHVTLRDTDGVQLSPPSSIRLHASYTERVLDVNRFSSQKADTDETLLYLAYGSNLSVEKFRKDRGIKPLAQINVQVPSLRLTFDLPGIPYAEPCFANSAPAYPEDDPQTNGVLSKEEEGTSLLNNDLRMNGYRKNAWYKGLIGVVYEVTHEDYAKIIATEGGGASYQDILVDCHPFTSSDPDEPVPRKPTTATFKAHTLFAPANSSQTGRARKAGRNQRPDPDYAQSSARYLKLITDGAAELRLPYEYQDYLNSLKPYTITTYRQRIGQAIFLGFWGPIVMSIFGLNKVLSDENGRVPEWLGNLLSQVFLVIWKSYDNVFKSAFGDGERTIGDNGGEDVEGQTQPGARPIGSLGLPKPTTDIEKLAALQHLAE